MAWRRWMFPPQASVRLRIGACVRSPGGAEGREPGELCEGGISRSEGRLGRSGIAHRRRNRTRKLKPSRDPVRDQCCGTLCRRSCAATWVTPGDNLSGTGEYCEIRGARAGLIQNLVYPLPHADGLSLGLHFTKTVWGTTLVGPTAAYVDGKRKL